MCELEASDCVPNGQHASTMRLARGRNSSPAAVSRADVEVARYPASAWDDGPFGRPAAVRAHVTDLEAKLDEKT